ncbi:hypothetical protein HYR99_14525 [Candidatus Poribacteria bacterium]|nr:hypothetical protein [Candidatus Poribacteria bacterium]
MRKLSYEWKYRLAQEIVRPCTLRQYAVGAYIASISCCPCCRDTLGEPVMTTLCRII